MMSVNVKTRRLTQIKESLKRVRSMWFLYLLLLPFLVLLYIYHYRPMYGVSLAFKKFYILKGISGSPWVGLQYFDQLFSAYSFWEVFRNTILISLYKLVFGFPMPIILALFLNELKNAKLKRVFQTISYLPHFLSWIILAGIVNSVFSPTRGVINYLRGLLGLDTVYYMASTDHFRGILVISSIWATVGWSSIIYIAAISGVDQQLYEAAMLDGANKLQLIWHVTLPYIRPIITIQFILTVSNILNAGFDQVFNLYSSAVFSVGDILDTYVYRYGLEKSNYSYATAVGLFKNVIGFALVIITNFVASKLNDGEGRVW